jgi:iron(III) transport system permease protein
MLQVGNELEEAARIHGASWIATMQHIFLPLIRHGLFVGFILVFVHAVKDLSLIIMLVSPRTQVLTVTATAFNDFGVDQLAYAVAVIIVVITLIGAFIAKKISKGDPMQVFQQGGGN